MGDAVASSSIVIAIKYGFSCGSYCTCVTATGTFVYNKRARLVQEHRKSIRESSNLVFSN